MPSGYINSRAVFVLVSDSVSDSEKGSSPTKGMGVNRRANTFAQTRSKTHALKKSSLVYLLYLFLLTLSITIMKLLLIASAFLFLGSFTEAEPTHIIKFKDMVNVSNGNSYSKDRNKNSFFQTAHSLLMSSHQAYEQSTAQVFSKKRDGMPLHWQLEPIQIGSNFMAMTGVFHDTLFLDYLRGGGAVEYVEPNQVYQVNRAIQPSDFHVSDAPNWGLARISHRTNTDLSSYSFYENAG